MTVRSDVSMKPCDCPTRYQERLAGVLSAGVIAHHQDALEGYFALRGLIDGAAQVNDLDRARSRDQTVTQIIDALEIPTSIAIDAAAKFPIVGDVATSILSQTASQLFASDFQHALARLDGNESAQIEATRKEIEAYLGELAKAGVPLPKSYLLQDWSLDFAMVYQRSWRSGAIEGAS